MSSRCSATIKQPPATLKATLPLLTVPLACGSACNLPSANSRTLQAFECLTLSVLLFLTNLRTSGVSNTSVSRFSACTQCHAGQARHRQKSGQCVTNLASSQSTKGPAVLSLGIASHRQEGAATQDILNPASPFVGSCHAQRVAPGGSGPAHAPARSAPPPPRSALPRSPHLQQVPGTAFIPCTCTTASSRSPVRLCLSQHATGSVWGCWAAVAAWWRKMQVPTWQHDHQGHLLIPPIVKVVERVLRHLHNTQRDAESGEVGLPTHYNPESLAGRTLAMCCSCWLHSMTAGLHGFTMSPAR